MNLKAAKALGLTIPESFLLRADWHRCVISDSTSNAAGLERDSMGIVADV
jgi:hypothetical protein